MLDDDERVSLVAEREEGRDQPAVVARVQPDARLVQDVEDARQVRAQLGREPDPLRLAAREGLRRPVERQVAQAHVVHELQALPDLRDDVAGDEPAALVQVERLAGSPRSCDGRAGDQGGEGERRPPAPEVELHGAGDAVEALRRGSRGRGRPPSPRSSMSPGPEAQLAQALRVLVLALVVRLEHPGIDAPVAPAGRAPAPRRIEREVLRIELGEGFPGLDVGPRRREPGEDLARARQEEARALAEVEGALEDRARPRLALQVGDHDLDVVLLVAVELLEGVGPQELPVRAQELVALPARSSRRSAGGGPFARG